MKIILKFEIYIQTYKGTYLQTNYEENKIIKMSKTIIIWINVKLLTFNVVSKPFI